MGESAVDRSLEVPKASLCSVDGLGQGSKRMPPVKFSAVRRKVLMVGIGAALFATVVYASGERPPVSGPMTVFWHVPRDTDGVFVTYQDLDNDGDYERATVSDIDILGRHTTTVRIVDVEPLETILARGERTTSGPTSVVTLSNVLLASEIQDADVVRVTISPSH